MNELLNEYSLLNPKNLHPIVLLDIVKIDVKMDSYMNSGLEGIISSGKLIADDVAKTTSVTTLTTDLSR